MISEMGNPGKKQTGKHQGTNENASEGSKKMFS